MQTRPVSPLCDANWLKGWSTPLFDLGCYLSQNPEVGNAGIDPPFII
jgi:hypothetical protein